MRDIIPTLHKWVSSGQKMALATVVKTWGSSPRPPGAKMAISESSAFTGSVSGGCVESAVIEEALQVIEREQPRILQYGVIDEQAWEVGLACGGEIEIFVEPFLPADEEKWTLLQTALQAIEADRTFVWTHIIHGPGELIGGSVLVFEGGETHGQIVDRLEPSMLETASALINQGNLTGKIGSQNDCQVFYEVFRPRPALILVGGVHLAIALASLAKVLGYNVYLVDPRRDFANQARFPNIDGIVQAWPDEGLQTIGITPSTAIAVLTHDPKLDDPALQVALRSPAFYVGALGSRKTQISRRARLLDSGLSSELLGRLKGPVGLDLRGDSPEEIALSIMAEIVAVRSGSPLVRRNPLFSSHDHADNT